MAPVSPAVVATKLVMPSARSRTVARDRLDHELDQARSVPLTVVSAPAGFGKTTLIADWLARRGFRSGWLSLESADDEPRRFWRYLLSAASNADPRLGRQSLARLDAPGSELEDVSTRFVNEAAGLDDDLVLVLDDYHRITRVEVHTAIARLIALCPPRLHLLLLARSTPPLPLGRLRVDDAVIELSADQLRFTPGEADRMLAATLGRPLSAHDLVRLVQRTEGWAAGLQLAGLRLQQHPEPGEVIKSFGGQDRQVADYLGEEVLADQPEAQRRFLIQTSILDQLSGPLCRAVTGLADAPARLEAAYRQNLFLIRLDDTGHWLRYHQLFQELLAQELARSDDAGAVAELHRRAARWYADEGRVDEAIGHALAAGDTDQVVHLVSRAWRATFNSGQWETVLRWLDALPDELVSATEELTIARVWIALDVGQLEEVDDALTAAERGRPLTGHLAVLRALHGYKTGDLGPARERLLALQGHGQDRFVDTVHALLCGVTALWSGRPADAAHYCGRAAALAERDANQLARIYALGYHALADLDLGSVDAAGRRVDEADELVRQTMGERHFVAMFPLLARARVALATDRPGDAVRPAAAALDLADRGAGLLERAAAALTLTEAQRLTGETTASQGSFDLARRDLRRCADPGLVLTGWLQRESQSLRAQDAAPDGRGPLTTREQEILRLLLNGQSQRQLAADLFVTPNTVKTHLRSIYRKLGVGSRAEAVRAAQQQGLA